MPAIQLRKGMTKEVYSKELSKLIGASVKVGDVFHMETKNGNVYLYFFGDYNGDYNGDKFSFLPLKELRRINSEDYIAALRASEKLG